MDPHFEGVIFKTYTAELRRRLRLSGYDGGSHTFGSRHPFAGPTPQLIQAMNATQTWFRRFL